MILSSLFFLLLMGCLLYLTIYGLWTFVISPQFGINKNRTDSDNVKKIESPEVENLLTSEFKYYQNLPSDLKPKFISRVIEFMNTQEFIGRENVVVTDEMRILISASATQLTFGLNKFTFDNFNKIILFPKEYLSKKDHRFHLGEVNLAGAIVLSWEDFKVGYFKKNENYNVGLHEMAHALRFDKFKYGASDDFFDGFFEKFLAVGKDEFLKIRAGQKSFLRKYAGTNDEEFFAVCVEYFFESPIQMKEKLPELFKNMCILLNQDPSCVLQAENYMRPALFESPTKDMGELYFSSSITYSLRIIPFLITFFILVFMNKSGFPFFGYFSVVLIAGGGFTLSKRFKKFKIYKNGFVVTYPLNPALKSIHLTFDRIISATLTRNTYTDRTIFNSYNDVLIINYTDGFNINSLEFSINTVSRDQMERVCAYLKREKVMIKIFGDRWTHQAIDEIQKQLV